MEYHIDTDTPISELIHKDSSDELVAIADMTLDELEHHGITGMKWGVRRFQNRDGSLTAAGKKRRAKLEAELDKLGGKEGESGGSNKIPLSRRQKKELAKIQKQRAENLAKARQAKIEKQKAAEDRAKKLEKGKIPVKDMTDSEIQDKINRINKELELKNLQTTRGKTFVEKFKDETVDKLAKNVAADLVAQTAKAVGTYGINKILNKLLTDAGAEKKDYVFTNNKRKDK